MAPKRSSLFGTPASEPSARSREPTEVPDVPVPLPAEAAPPPAAPAPAPVVRYPKAKTREGKRVATCYLEREAHRQLQKIVFDEETTMQDLLTEGITAVFERRGLSRIA